MMNDYEVDLDDFPAENKENPPESLVGAYRAESDRSIHSRKVESQQRFHLFLMDQRRGSVTRS